MKLPAQLTPVLQWWRTREARERQILQAGAAILLLVMLWLLVWQPLTTDLAKLEKVLPRLRGDLMTFERDARLLRSLNKTSTTAPRQTQDLLADIQQGLTNAGLTAPAQPHQEGGLVYIDLAGVSFNAWLAAVQRLQNEYGVTLRSASVTRAPADAGMVNVTAAFAR
jgi:general secretion pathway protein M